uniref:DUF3326 domain-containing protein n=1 Tax=viral metagenome TaxID=1070528 RepID=A0A6M3IUT9_9ZZZZ
MNTVFIIPTGIGCKIGGHAGDATPAFKLIASVSDIAITHPNVVNASDINEMPDNTWYVEGSILDRFLEGEFCLKKPKSNKILLVVNKPITSLTLNAVSAARHTIGCEIEICELEHPFEMWGDFNPDGSAGGSYAGIHPLLEQIQNYQFDALALATSISVPKDINLGYLRNGGINPWGGIEAIVSKIITNQTNKPVAHSPIENEDPEVFTFDEVVNSRIAAEVLSSAYIHCVFKGLHKAPRISKTGLHVSDIDCLITPWGCFGRPHEACIKAGIDILGIKENTTYLNKSLSEDVAYWVDNYVEAAGWLKCKKIGITRYSVSEDYKDEEIYA